MATHKLLLLPGDGIGPEVMGEVKRLIDWLNRAGHRANSRPTRAWSAARPMTRTRCRSPRATWRKAKAADAIIFGAVGGPKWDSVPYEVRPEAGLLRLRKDLACSPICGPPSAIRRWPMPPA